MKSKTTVTIFDMDFTLVGEETDQYAKKVAALVDARMREVSTGTGLSTVAAAILAAANIADDYFKALDSADGLRVKIREYFDEISRLKDENAELRRHGGQKRGYRSAAGDLPDMPEAAPDAPVSEAYEDGELTDVIEQLELDK